MDDENVDDLDYDDSLNVFSVGSCMDQLNDDDEVNEHHDISDSHNIPGILEEQFALADDRFEDHVDESDPDFIIFNDFDGSRDITQDNIIDDHFFLLLTLVIQFEGLFIIIVWNRCLDMCY
jgi:hypothetical protein